MTFSKRAFSALALVATNVSIVSSAYAQQGAAVLTGRIEDAATKQPVADVVVTVTSPNLQGEQIVVTDSTGQYRIPNLPSGAYTLRLEKEQYKPYARPDITLRADTTIRVDASLLPESLKAEEIVVVGRAPTVDVGSSSTGMNISSDFTRRVPVSAPGGKGAGNRSFESVAEAAPGAGADDYGTSINGTTSPENSYVIDGLTVNNPALGIIGTPLSTEFVGEVNVLSGGYMPEYGRSTGGILSAGTKSGSNEFRGQVWAFFSPGALEGSRKKVRREGSTIVNEPALLYSVDDCIDHGGPIVKDNLWFYTGVDVARTAYHLGRSLYRTKLDANGEKIVTDGITETEYLPGSRRNFDASVTTLQLFGKLTYTIDENNKLILTLIGSPTYSGGNGEFGVDPTTGKPETDQAGINGTQSALGHKFNGGSFDGTLKWTSEKNNKRLLFDTTVGWHHEEGGTKPSDGSKIGGGSGLASQAMVSWRRNSNPGFHSITDFENVPDPALCAPVTKPDGTQALPCSVTGYFLGGPDFIDDQKLDRYQARHIVTILAQGLGHHVVKGGVDFEFMQYNHLRAYSGGRRFRESTTGTSFSDQRQYGFMTGPDQAFILDTLRWKTNAVTVGGFVQDSWSILDKVTLNIGMRYDAQFVFGGDGNLALSLPNQWSPRVGVIYDPTQEGRSKIFANYARFYESVPLDIADRAGSSEPQITSSHRAATCDPRDLAQQTGSCLTDANRRRIGSASSPDQKWTITGAGKTPIDPDLKPQSSDEVVFGGEYELIKDGRAGVTYTRRWMNNVIEDMSRDEAQTYFIGNPGTGIASDFPKAERNYDAVTMYFQKSFSDLWLAQLSYTISYLRGNYAGLYRPETAQIDPNINSDFDLKSLTVNRTGPLPGDHTHDIKLFAARDIEFPGSTHLNVGGAFRARSGAPSNYLSSHPLYGADEVFLLPRGSGERLPWVFNIDTNLAYGIKFSKEQTLTFTVDIFNLINFQAETTKDQRYTASDIQPIRSGGLAAVEAAVPVAERAPNFGRATQYQAPRTFRFGIRTTF
jgi:hypothetical protein